MPLHVSRRSPQVVSGAVLIRDQFGNGVGDISIDIRRSDGGQVVPCLYSTLKFSFERACQLEGLMWSENENESGRLDVV